MSNLTRLRSEALGLAEDQNVPLAGCPVLDVHHKVREAYPNLTFDFPGYIGAIACAGRIPVQDLQSMAVSIQPRRRGEPLGLVSERAAVVQPSSPEAAPKVVCYPRVTITVPTSWPKALWGLAAVQANVTAHHEARHVMQSGDTVPPYYRPSACRKARAIGLLGVSVGPNLMVANSGADMLSVGNAMCTVGATSLVIGGLAMYDPSMALYMLSGRELDAHLYAARATPAFRPLRLG